MAVTPFKDLALPEFATLARADPPFRIFFKDDSGLPMENKAEVFISAAIPIFALDGEDCKFEDRIPFFHYLQNSPAGHVLSQMSCHARKSRVKWARFCHSVRQPGFIHAWFAVTPLFVVPDTESLSDQVKRLRREPEKPMDELTRHIAEKARNSIPLPGTPEFETFIEEQAKFLNSIRKKQARKRAPKLESRYKTIVSIDFLANALWCRSTSDIVSEYFPDSNATEHERHEREFNKAFSGLKLSKARRNDIPQCPDIHG